MKNLRHIGILIVAALLLSGCGVSKIKEISLTSMGIKYIVPTSSRTMDAKLILGIDNPARNISVQDIAGTIFYDQKPIANFITGNLELEGKTLQDYELPCSVTLADGVSLLDILVIAAKGSLEDLTADVDVQAALRKNGILRKPWSFKGLTFNSFSQ